MSDYQGLMGAPCLDSETWEATNLNRIAGESTRLQLQLPRQYPHILIAAPGKIHHQYVMRRHCRSKLQRLRHRMRALKRRQNALRPRQPHHRIQRRRIVGRHILRAPRVMQRRVLRPNRRIIQPRTHRMRQRNLPIRILQHVRIRPLQNPGRSARQKRTA